MAILYRSRRGIKKGNKNPASYTYVVLNFEYFLFSPIILTFELVLNEVSKNVQNREMAGKATVGQGG